MEKFKHYGQIKVITKGKGILNFDQGKDYEVSFEIAKKGKEELLFNVLCDDLDQFHAIELFNSCEKLKISGKDEKGLLVKASNLMIKDIEAKSENQVAINGYVGKCEVGKKKTNSGYTIEFNLLNFLFIGNELSVIDTESGKNYSKAVLDLRFLGLDCKIKRKEDYPIVEQYLKRQGGIYSTSTLTIIIERKIDLESVFVKLKKLCQLLSVARSTFINWNSLIIKDEQGDVIYELYGNAQTRPFHGNNLIDTNPEHTIKFLGNGWRAYMEYEEVFDLGRFFYGYSDSYLNSYVETRSLNIAVLIDNLASKWAIKDKRDNFIENKKFLDLLPQLKNRINSILTDMFDNLQDKYKKGILTKVNDFNRRPLDWKIKRLKKHFKIPITDNEIARYLDIRNSLVHSSTFPEDVDSTESFLFMRHFLDRMILSILNYNGSYFNYEKREELL